MAKNSLPSAASHVVGQRYRLRQFRALSQFARTTAASGLKNAGCVPPPVSVGASNRLHRCSIGKNE
jgi:hypothetical protein